MLPGSTMLMGKALRCSPTFEHDDCLILTWRIQVHLYVRFSAMSVTLSSSARTCCTLLRAVLWQPDVEKAAGVGPAGNIASRDEQVLAFAVTQWSVECALGMDLERERVLFKAPRFGASGMFVCIARLTN